MAARGAGSRVMRCAPSGGVGCDDVLAGSAGATIRVVSTSADTPTTTAAARALAKGKAPNHRMAPSRCIAFSSVTDGCEYRVRATPAQTLFAHASHVRHEWRNSGCAREKRSLSGA